MRETDSASFGGECRPDPLDGYALCWGCVPGTGLTDLAALAARHGFREISVRPRQYFAAAGDDPAWRGKFDDAGVRVGVIDAMLSRLPGAPEPHEVPQSLRPDYALGLDDCLEAAEALGARALNVAHYLGSPVPPDELADAVGEIADAAARIGVAVALEFIPDTGIPDLAAALDIARRAARPNAGVLFDSWHFLRNGGALGDIAGLAQCPVVEAQLSDRRTPAPGEEYVPMKGRLPLGEGEAPLAAIARALRQAAPETVFSLEIFPDQPGDPDRTVAHLAETTRTFAASHG
ncbi:sugar phosphate isomerase/epimerase family protein [Tomitella gaofuii]|uniref:sugar phosphate isomerase/epimerase family protein n=1 Tax=Tomitella gaofuii TaxID=2760083 RepID=UPI0015FBAAED|nr:sugar phosphate isomerase/epimerase family protein [Tomitella gaofuii]